MQHEIIMPVLGMNQDVGTISAWYKNIGDAVEESDVLMDIETDKAVMEIEAKHAGILVDIRYASGSEVPVGTVVAVIDTEATRTSVTEEAHTHTQPESIQEKSKESKNNENDEVKEIAVSTQSPQPENVIPLQNKRILSSPKARMLAGHYGVTLEEVSHHASQSLLHAKEVIAYIDSNKNKQVPVTSTETIPNQCVLTLHVKAQPLKDCEEWLLHNHESKRLNLGHLISFLTVEMLQKYQLIEPNESVTVKTETWSENQFQTSAYQHSKRVRFSSIEFMEEVSAAPHIRLINMVDSLISDVSFSRASQPLIILQETDSHYVIKILGFQEEQFTVIAQVCQDLTVALKQPLLHLA